MSNLPRSVESGTSVYWIPDDGSHHSFSSDPNRIFQMIQNDLISLENSRRRQDSNHTSITSSKSAAHVFRIFSDRESAVKGTDGESAQRDQASSVGLASDEGLNAPLLISSEATKSTTNTVRIFTEGGRVLKDQASSIGLPSDEVVNTLFFQFDSGKIIQIIKNSFYNLDAASLDPVWDDVMPIHLLLTYLYTRESMNYYDLACDIGILEGRHLKTVGHVRFTKTDVTRLGLNESIVSFLSEEINRELTLNITL